MALSLPVPEIAFATTFITLGGIEYSITYSFNERDERWRMDILANSEPVILGVKIMEEESLLGRYRLPLFAHGDIFCLRIKDDGKQVGRSNLGFDLPYELIYLTNAEIELAVQDVEEAVTNG